MHPSRSPRLRRALLALLLAFVLGAPAAAFGQLQVASLQGRVVDAASAGVAAATVLLQDASGNAIRSTTAAGDGSFRIADVAPGSYVLRVELAGVVALSRSLVVRGSLPVELTLRTGLALAESVVVRGDAGFNTVERPWSLSGSAVHEAAEPMPSQRVQATLGSLPGWRVEDNGLLHVRGVDDGLLYVQDGIPVYARLDRLFGMPPTASGIASIHVLNGYIPPEFGFKSGAVVEVRTESGIRSSWTGLVDTGVADLDTRHVEGFAGGPLGSRAGLMLTGSDERSSRFLDPVALENFHNDGRTSSLGAQLTYGTAGNLFTGSGQIGRTRYEVPHGATQESAGQDQRQRTTQMLVSGSWQRVLSAGTAWQASAYRRTGIGHAVRLARRHAGHRRRAAAGRALRRARQPHPPARTAHGQGRRGAVRALAARALLVRGHRPRGSGGGRAERRGHRPGPGQPVRLRRPPPSLARLAVRAGCLPGVGSAHAELRRAIRPQHAAGRSDSLVPARRRGLARAERNHAPRVVAPALPAAAGRVPAAVLLRGCAPPVAVRQRRHRRWHLGPARTAVRPGRVPDAGDRPRVDRGRVRLAAPRHGHRRPQRLLRHDGYLPEQRGPPSRRRVRRPPGRPGQSRLLRFGRVLRTRRSFSSVPSREACSSRRRSRRSRTARGSRRTTTSGTRCLPRRATQTSDGGCACPGPSATRRARQPGSRPTTRTTSTTCASAPAPKQSTSRRAGSGRGPFSTSAESGQSFAQREATPRSRSG